jgi:predicted lactoylglutathione lyase
MNDLIKEFAKQAGFKVNWQHEDVQAIKMAQYKEFAELIVRECANRATWAQDIGERDIGGEVLKHFGVRE